MADTDELGEFLGDFADVVVEREPGAPYVTFDVGIIAHLGRDLEASLFAISPRVTSLKIPTKDGVGGPREVAMMPVYREVVKLRMSPTAAVQFALNALFALRENEPDTFESALNDIDRLAGRTTTSGEESIN